MERLVPIATELTTIQHVQVAYAGGLGPCSKCGAEKLGDAI